MADSILTIVRQFCARTGLPQPSTVFGSPDTQVLQYGALANEILEDMMDRGYWQELEQEATFTTVATESQGNINTIAPNGLNYFINMTFYDRSLRLPVYGPLSPQDWQALKALPNTGPLYKYRIRGDQLLFNPVPVAGHTCAIEYMSEWVVAVAGVPAKKWFTADTDTPFIDANAFMNGCRWRWKAEKGFDYAEDFRMYEETITNSLARNGTKRAVNIAGSLPRAMPGIFVPSGSWNV